VSLERLSHLFIDYTHTPVWKSQLEFALPDGTNIWSGSGPNVNYINIDIQAMLVCLTLPFSDFCGFRSDAVNSVYKLQFLHFIYRRQPVRSPFMR